MIAIIEPLITILKSKELHLLLQFVYCAVKFWLLFLLFNYRNRLSMPRGYFFLLVGMLVSMIFEQGFLIERFVQSVFFPEAGLALPFLFARISWISFIIINQLFILFIGKLVDKRFKLKRFHYLTFFVNIPLALSYFFLIMFIPVQMVQSGFWLTFELLLCRVVFFVTVFLFQTIAIYQAFRQVYEFQAPKLVLVQLKNFVSFFIPMLFIHFLPTRPITGWFFVLTEKLFIEHPVPLFLCHRTIIYLIAQTIVFVALYRGIQKMMSARFMNINKRVQGPALSVCFPTELKDAMTRLNTSQSFGEVDARVKGFLRDAFDVPVDTMRFYVRYTGQEILTDERLMDAPEELRTIEHFMDSIYGKQTFEARVLHVDRALFYDELEFSQYYDDKNSAVHLLSFLDRLNAEAFLPIYEGNIRLAGVLVIKKGARGERLYSRAEQDAMISFVSHVSLVIASLHRKNYYSLVQENKELKEGMVHNVLQRDQYQESIRSFVRTTKEHKIGVVYYRHRNFTIANAEAREFLQSDPNSEQGDLLSNSLRVMARDVEEFRTEKSMLTKNVRGTKLKITAFHHPEHHSVIMLIHRPEISDLVKMQANVLKDPTLWDYLLWLDTTQAGELLNKLLPGMGTTVLNFKINLLETALGIKATLLDMAEEDAYSMVKVIHTISGRNHLHTIKLTTPERDNEVAIKLFGINKLLLPTEQKPEEELLKKLDEVGTLYIQDVHFLNLETQTMLAKFLRFGLYSPVKSDHELSAQVRIICSSTQNLPQLVQEGRFSKDLLHELKKMVIVMPALHELSAEEMTDLAEGYKNQLMQEDTYRNFLAFTEKDRNSILADRPVSLSELKNRVKSIVASKTVKHKLTDMTEFDPAYYIADPDVARAARLGKRALRDKKLLSELLVKFEYNQAKIATLLGVNRSTVHRRCITYKLSESTLVKFAPLKKEVVSQEPESDQQAL